MKILPVALLLLLTVAALGRAADEAATPSYPPPGVDLVLTKGKSAQEFFAERAADKTGRAALAEAQATYRADRAKLDAMLKAKDSRSALDTQEIALENSRYKLLLKMEECGPCATDEVKAVKLDAGGDRSQYWYILDGSYRIEAANEALRAKKSQRLKQLLLSVPDKRDRSRSVIDYLLVDNATGKPLENLRTIDRSPFYAFTSVGKPAYGGVLACDFYLRGTYQTMNLQPPCFVIKTEVVTPPTTFTPPLTEYASSGGKNYPTHHESVYFSLGMTYLTNDGYLRVWNATSYGSDVEVVEVGRTMMRRAHLDVLIELEERLETAGVK